MSVATVYLLARILTCGVWVAAGLFKATHFEGATQEMAHNGIPVPKLVLPFVLALEMVGSLMLVVDYFVWLVAVAWLVFLVPATYLYHGRYMVKDGTIDFIQFVMTWKNISIAGGLLLLIILDNSRPDWLIAA